MQTKSLNLEDFPDSAYAHELRRGIRRLRFDTPLEAEYTTAHLKRVRPRVQIWFSVAVILSLLFTIEQVQRTGIWNAVSLAHVGGLVPAAIALVWLAWSGEYQRFFLPAARILVPVHSGLVGVHSARAHHRAGRAIGVPYREFAGGILFHGAHVSPGAVHGLRLPGR
jgi:hypothetical protein